MKVDTNLPVFQFSKLFINDLYWNSGSQDNQSNKLLYY